MADDAPAEPPQRKIIHIDMDAFFAAIEQRDHPELRGKPIAVGGSSGRGVVITASYEARPFGVRSAMPSVVAKRLCPNLIFVKSRMDVYREASQIIRGIFAEYSDIVEPLSLDEAYLDVTSDIQGVGSATAIAETIRRRIFEATGLTASAGISYNKSLAKIASDMNKPNGQLVIRPHQAAAFLESLPIEKFHGIGRATAAKLHALDIHSGSDLKAIGLEALVRRFGKSGRFYHQVVCGEDPRQVKSSRIRKSVSAEHTFSDNKLDGPALRTELDSVAQRLLDRIRKAEVSGYTVTLKIKFHDFEIISKRLTLQQPVDTLERIIATGSLLLGQMDINRPVRLIGIGLSNLKPLAHYATPQTELAF